MTLKIPIRYLIVVLLSLNGADAFVPHGSAKDITKSSCRSATVVNGEAPPSKLSITTVEDKRTDGHIRLTVNERARTVTTSCTSGTLCTTSQSDGIEGSPFGSYVDYVLDDEGNPVLLMNDLSMHTMNILSSKDNGNESLCSLFVQLQHPGSTGQDVSRCSVTGTITKISDDAKDIDTIRLRYSITHSYADRVMDSPKFSFYRLNPKKVYFVGGFGVLAKWVPVEEYLSAEPDILAGEAFDMVKKLNRDDHKEDLMLAATHLLDLKNIEDIRVTSIDRLGFDVRVTNRETRLKVKTNEFRLGFRIPVVSVEDAKSEVLKIFQEAWEKGQGYSWEDDDALPGSTIPIMKIAEDSLE